MSLSLTTTIELQPGAQIMTFDSSTTGQNYRVELTDGRHFQVNERLRNLLEALRTPLTLPALAAAFEQRTGQSVALDQLQQVSTQLVEQGMVIESGKAPVAAPAATTNGFLGLHYRRDLLSPAAIAPLARIFQGLFNWWVAALLLPVIGGAHLLAYRELGFPPNLQMADVSWPLVYALLLVSVFLHELGHLAACHRWQAPHGPLGVGLYFFAPVFYVDVTGAWRLTRYQRAAVDIGGAYLQLLFVPLALLLFWATQDPSYLMVIAIIDLVLLSNLEPLMKLDGYWLLSDLTGVPNLHARTGEALQRGLGWLLWKLGQRNEAPPPSVFSQWSGWVRGVLWVYMVCTTIMLPLMLLAMIPLLIDAVLTYPALWQSAFSTLVTAAPVGDVGAILAALHDLFLPTLTLLGAGLMLKMTWQRFWQSRQVKAGQRLQAQPA